MMITAQRRSQHVVSHLFNHNFCEKRFKAWFCENHEPGRCKCDLVFSITSVYVTPILRVIKRAGLSDVELVQEMILWIESHFKYVSYMYRLVDQPNLVKRTGMALHMLESPNMTMLSKQQGLPTYSMPVSTELPPEHPILVGAYQTWDLINFSNANKPGFFRENAEKKFASPPSLAMLCEMRMSTYNMAFGYNDFGTKRSVQARGNLYENDKLVKLQQEFSRDTSRLSDNAKQSFSRYGTRALKLLYSQYLKTSSYFGKFWWRYSRELFQENIYVNFSTSSGFSLQTEESLDYDGVVYRKKKSSYKKEYMEQYFGIMDQLQTQACQGEDLMELRRGITNIAMKNEVFNDWEKTTLEGVTKTKLKCRHFAITEVLENLAAAAHGKLRQNLERGDFIRVGMKWWHGGAMEMARILKYDPILYPDQTYGIGDFEKFDKGVNRFLLQLYMAESVRYVDKNFNGPDRRMYDHILKFLIDAIGTKIVHLPGGVWGVLDGVMPSGHCDTSHGDSWIVMFLYCMLIVSQMHGPKAAKISQYLKEGRIVIVVYGDDHIISTPRDVYNLLGEEAFARYVKVWGMNIRDIETVPFLSEIGQRGELKTKGVCFLQRYFVKTSTLSYTVPGMPPIVPFRPMFKHVTKLSYGGGDVRTLADIVLAITGHAYDTMGTNMEAYLFLGHCYQYVVKHAMREHSDFDEEMSRYVKDTGRCTNDITKMLRKANITLDELLVFPTLDSLLKKHCEGDVGYHIMKKNLGVGGLYYTPI